MSDATGDPPKEKESAAARVTAETRSWLIGSAVVGSGLLVAYLLLPVGSGGPVSGESQIMFFVGVTLLTGTTLTIAVREVRHTNRSSIKVRMTALFFVISGSIFFFSQTYYRVAQSPGEFDSLTTRLDAMYFTITTVMTVGYGDVHAAGQLARGYVLLHMIFNAIVIGTAIKVMGFLARSKNESRRSAAMSAAGSGDHRNNDDHDRDRDRSSDDQHRSD